MDPHDFDKALALLKSLGAECDLPKRGQPDHAWLVLEELRRRESDNVEPDEATAIGEPWTDEQMAQMREYALRGDLRNARRLLEANGYSVYEEPLSADAVDPVLTDSVEPSTRVSPLSASTSGLRAESAAARVPEK